MASTAEASSSSSGAQLDASARLATPMNRNNPAFLNKLRSMLDDKTNEDLIKWAPDGKSFFVPNHIRFGDTLLPRYFKHRNFSSFVRQLNMYGFHKVPHLQQGALDADQAAQSELWEFTNDLFTRDQPELTAQVQRKKATKNAAGGPGGQGGNAGEGFGAVRPNQLLLTDAPYNGTGEATEPASFPPAPAFDGASSQNMHLHPLFPALQAITVAQTNINSELSRLRSSNDDLWREAIDTRQRLKKQQDTVNKVIRFLAGVFGGRALANVSEDEGLPNVGAGTSSNAPEASSSSRGDGSGARATGTSSSTGTNTLDNARRVAVYRPSMTANGRLLIGDGRTEQASSSRGGRTSESPMTDQGDGRQAEIFELPEIEEVQDDGSRFIEAVSPSQSPPGGSTAKLNSPSLRPNSSLRSPSFRGSSGNEMRSVGESRRTNGPSSAVTPSGGDSNAASNWFASILGQGQGVQNPMSDGSSSSLPGLSAAASQLDPGAMAALQSLFNSTSGSPVRTSLSAHAPGSGMNAASSNSFSSAMSLPSTFAGTLATASNGNNLMPPPSNLTNTPFWSTASGTESGPASSSAPNRLALPSSNTGYSNAGSVLANGSLAAPSSGSNAPHTAAAAVGPSNQMLAANPELAQHTGEVAQTYEDMQRTNMYLQALIDGIMQQGDGSAAGAGTGAGTGGTAPGPSMFGNMGNVAGGGSGNTPRAGSGNVQPNFGPLTNASSAADLEALLHEFLDPAAASTPTSVGRPTFSPRASFGFGGGGSTSSGQLEIPKTTTDPTESPLWAGEDDDEEDEDDEDQDDEDEENAGASGMGHTEGVFGNERLDTSGRKRKIDGSDDESMIPNGNAEPALKRSKASI
ncbi:unnamed protein product [Tilletia laevis]|uniref:HSF-type DNA-binding domain-containing protein n=3 Tax=Tilletia TaxID=13289 RepID=A0A8X7MRL9_9BASI|nr:hypothetical protein CF336_g4492 [Tilletia laevis]KAE8192641.1 hypothetical protein CF328_g5296 [Tilletia controversa]KAE8259402.1 hypothetical protein A4X03_0g4101 [Tilletia caries]KAE8200261.1 hypothetical protein CF335_g3994 [Tilletia laevis]KAE8246725.1 hypothetical protein A4X06_0g4902 [Tilletia controversa]